MRVLVTDTGSSIGVSFPSAWDASTSSAKKDGDFMYSIPWWVMLYRTRESKKTVTFGGRCSLKR